MRARRESTSVRSRTRFTPWFKDFGREAVHTVADESDFEHALKNYIAIILGYADLVLEEMAPDDPRLPDIREIHKAATAAVALLNSHRSPSN